MQTRSGRLAYTQRPSLQAHQQQSSSSTASSATSSLYQSSSSSLATFQTASNPQRAYTMPSAQQQQQQLQLQQQQQQHQQRHMTTSAPMPSPSASNGQSATGYFAASKTSQADPYRTAPAGATQTPETAPFLRDFTLLAEAAKRAQMACLARDMGDIGI